jgi:hypothetical protein
MPANPDTPPEVIDRLKQVRHGLLRLHKVLLDSEAAAYDREVRRLQSRSELLSLVLHDPWFAWLHELSQLIVQIDMTIDGEEAATAADAEKLVGQTRLLLTPAQNGAGFSKHYDAAMQRDPSVVLAHGEMMGVLGKPA